MANINKKRFPGGILRTAGTRGLAWVSLLLCAAILLPGKAQAQSCAVGAGGTQILTATLPTLVNVPRDAPAGTPIPGATYTFPAVPSGQNIGVLCTGSGSVQVVSTNLKAGASTNGVIPTGIPGIGYQIATGASVVNTNPGVYFTVAQLNALCNPPTTNCHTILSRNAITVRLVTTGTGVVANSRVSDGDLFQVTVGGLVATKITLGGYVNVSPQTCIVTTPSPQVPLGAVKSSTFSGVGSVSSDSAKSFQIGLNCSGLSTQVGITFTDNTNPGNTTSVLSLTPGSTAGGVGIRIAYPSSSTVISYGPDSPLAGNPNQLMLGLANNNANHVFSFTGQYVQQAATITPGTAKGIATFTMSYQ